MNLRAPETFTHFLKRDAVFDIGEKRNFFSSHCEQYDVLVQHFVMLEIVKQCERRSGSITGHVNGCSRDAPDLLAFQIGQEHFERNTNVARDECEERGDLFATSA